MSENESNDMKYGINWAFLKTLLEIYEHMISDQYIFIKSLSKNSNVNPKVAYADLAAALFTFYSIVRHQFDPYLIKKNGKLKPSDFIEILNTIDVSKNKQSMQIIDMILEISLWSNSEGCFKTLTKTVDPMAPNHF